MSRSRTGLLRIIGGKWRSRKFSFPSVDAIRPTPDSLRETLFNWLQFRIVDKICLDLFAGSGALGFEALSRGAKQVYFVEKNKKVSLALRENLALLGEEAENGLIFNTDAAEFLSQQQMIFDVVFLDPPFNQGLLENTIKSLISHQLIDEHSLVFIETEQKSPNIPLNIIKKAKSGQSHIFLAQL